MPGSGSLIRQLDLNHSFTYVAMVLDVVERDARSTLQRYAFVVIMDHLASVRKHSTFMENMR